MYTFMNTGIGNWGKKGSARFGSNHTSIGDFMMYCQLQDIYFKGKTIESPGQEDPNLDDEYLGQEYPHLADWYDRMSKEKGLKEVHQSAGW